MTQEIVLSFLRWFHVIAGILWLGVAYIFVFVIGPASATMAPDLKRSMAEAFTRRSFSVARWASLLAWLSGVTMLGLLYHAGGRMFDNAADGWNAAAGISVLLVFFLFGLYDVLARLSFFSDLRRLGLLGLLVTIAMVELMSGPAGMGYSASLIHIGTMYGTIMVANLWMRMWPAQREALTAFREGRQPDPGRLASAVLRGRHNAYLSIPLLWTMIGQHTVIPGALSPLWFYGVIVVGWGLVALLEWRSKAPVAA